MTPQQKLLIIQTMSGLTQTELATQLGVTFVALNRWFSGKVQPRAAAQIRIDELYSKHTGQKIVPSDPLSAKKDILRIRKNRHPHPLTEMRRFPDVMGQYILSLTYNSNSIEGSTLSENETADILFQNATLSHKSLTEHLEAKNHQAALQFLFQPGIISQPISEEIILKLHSILMNSIRPDAGYYRNHGVRIVGSYVPTANYIKIPQLMKELVDTIRHQSKDIVVDTTIAHSRFEQIHPFSDGNGRIGRMLIHWMLLKANYPPAVILQKKRRAYYNALNRAQLHDDTIPLEDFLCDSLFESYHILDHGETILKKPSRE